MPPIRDLWMSRMMSHAWGMKWNRIRYPGHGAAYRDMRVELLRKQE
jgi:hypothetical protein